MSDSLWPHELQHARPPCHHQLLEFTQTHVHRVSDAIQPSHPLSSPFSSCPQSLPASESFPMSQLFAWGGQSTGVSAWASFLPKKSQGWSPSEWIGCYTMFINMMTPDCKDGFQFNALISKGFFKWYVTDYKIYIEKEQVIAKTIGMYPTSYQY